MSWLHTHRKTILLLVILLVIILVFFRQGGISADDITSSLADIPPLLSGIILIGLFCLKPLAVVSPSSALYLAAGVLLSPISALVVIYTGSVIEAGIGYALGRRLGAQQISRLMERDQRVKRLLTYQQDNSAGACFLTRILPVPFDLASMFYGASGTRFGVFLPFSLLGSTPWIISCTFAGNAINQPLSREFLVPFGICLLISSFAFLLSRRIQR